MLTREKLTQIQGFRDLAENLPWWVDALIEECERINQESFRFSSLLWFCSKCRAVVTSEKFEICPKCGYDCISTNGKMHHIVLHSHTSGKLMLQVHVEENTDAGAVAGTG